MERDGNHSLETVPICDDPYGYYLGSGVEVALTLGSKISGMYRGITKKGKMVLGPHLAWEPRFDNKPCVPYLSNMPAFISIESIVTVLPTDYRELEKTVNLQRDKLLTGFDNIDPACLI